MARQVLPWVGAAVGMMWGNPQLGFAIGSIIGNAVDPQVIRGPQLGEGQNNSASEGGYRPIVLGKGAVGVCMIHEGPIIKRTIRTRQSKGGGPVTTEERAYRTMAFGLGESADPTQGVTLLRLWIDNKLRYDVTPTSQIVAESAQFAQEFTFYPGDETQLPDPDLEAYMGVGEVPAYRGGAPYIVMPHWDVTQSGGRAPMIKAELGSSAIIPGGIVAFRDPNATYSQYAQIGSDWNVSWTTSTSLQRFGWQIHSLTLDGGRILYYTGARSPAYTDDAGETFTVSGGDILGASGGVRLGWAVRDVVVIAGGVGDMGRSTDRGQTFSNVASSPDSNAICAVWNESSATWFSYYPPANAFRTSSNGETWSASVTMTMSRVDSRWSDGQTAMFGGGLTGSPHIVATQTGSSFNVQSLPSFASATFVTAIREHEGLWVCATDSGEFAYRDEFGAWNLASDSLGARVYEMTHDGTQFIAICNGILATSVDGETWVTRATWTSSGDLSSAVAATGTTIAIAEKIPLSYIVSWVHERVDAERYNVSELTDMVEGVVFAEGYTAADAIRSASSVYFFDAMEADVGSGYRINYVKRGGAAVVTLTENDIVDGPEDWEREDSYERPKVLHVAYQNPIADYGAPNIAIKRTSPDVLVVGERSGSVPFVFSDVNEITQRCDVMMTIIYTEIAGKYEIILPDSLLTLAPTNVIGFSIRGRVRRLRMTGWRYDGGTIKTEWMADRQSAYTSNVTGLPVVPSSPPPPSIVGPTVSAVLDIPAIADSLDTLHAIVAHTGQTPAWYGSTHQRQAPSDPDFATTNNFGTAGSVIGLLQDEVTAASQHYTDTTNVIRVTLYRDDELQTFTNQQFLSENGAFALSYLDGDDRRWEILQYRDAVKLGPNQWELTTLHRGRLDTDAAEHPAGSLFVLLDFGVQSMPMQTSWIGEEVTHRAVSNGQNPDQAIPYTEEYTGQSQREWPVAHLFGGISSDTLTLTAIPRHRFGTDDHPVRSANWDGYRYTATDGVNSATLDSVSSTVGFDVTGWSTPITATVSQLNRITGAGPSVSEQFE